MIASNEIQDAQIVASALCNTISDLISQLDDSVARMSSLQTGPSPKLTATPAGLAAQLETISACLYQISVLNGRVVAEVEAIRQINETTFLADMDTATPIAA